MVSMDRLFLQKERLISRNSFKSKTINSGTADGFNMKVNLLNKLKSLNFVLIQK